MPKEKQDGLISLSVKNFQRFEKYKIVFSPSVTTIVGPSDKGKSSLLRALGCVATGTPDGQELIRHDTDGYAIKLVLPDCEVIRRRGKAGNVFVLDGQKLTRDRSDWPPAKVLAATRLGPENFQWQLDGPLWFLDSAGTVAKQLNKVVDLEAIDAVLAAANSVAKTAIAAQEGATQEYESAKHAYHSLKWVPDMVAAWEHLSERKARLEKTRGRSEYLKTKTSQIKRMVKNKAPASMFKEFATISAKREQAAAKKKAAEELASVCRRVADLKRRANAVKLISEPFAALAAMRQAGERAARDAGELTQAVEHLRELLQKRKLCQEKLAEAKKEAEKVPVCPACGQTLPSGSQ